MAHFKFVVSGQKLTLKAAIKSISDTLNANSAEFDFRSPEWEGAYKVAHFANPKYNDGGYYDFILDHDTIPEEAGLNLPSGVWDVYVHGDFYNGSDVVKRLVTESKSIQVIPSAIIHDEPRPSLDSSVGEQVLGMATEALDARIVSATASVDSNTGVPSVEVSITGAPTFRNIDLSFHNLRGFNTVFTDTDSDGHIVVSYD